MSDEETTVQGAESPSEPAQPDAPPEETAPPEEPPAEVDPADCVAVAQDGTCPNCDWEWGSEAAHIVSITADVAPVTEGTVEPPPPPEPKPPDPDACPPTAFQATCPKCGWSGLNPETASNPHPVA